MTVKCAWTSFRLLICIVLQPDAEEGNSCEPHAIYVGG